MVTEKEFSSVFDYNSAFKYGLSDINMKPLRSTYKSAFSYHAIVMPEDNVDNSFHETWLSIVLRKMITVILFIIVVVSFPISIFVCLKKVNSLERIVLLRLGKLQPIRGPGFAIILPCIDKWTKVDLRPKHFTVSSTQALTADGGIVEAKSDIEYRVADVISYVMKLKQQESTLRELSLMCLGNIISEKDLEDLEIKREIINCNFKNEINRSAINWGLEIISVNMHSLKVLKAAEPVDAIGTILTALKAATGQSSDTSPSMMPFLSQTSEKPIPSHVTTDICVPDADERDILTTIEKLVDDVVSKEKVKDIRANYLLDINNDSFNRKIFICFDEEGVTVHENTDDCIISDVVITLNEEILRQFLNGRLSPLDAYMDGKITVSGDWKLLKFLPTIFH